MHRKRLRVVIVLASFHFAAGVAMSQSPIPTSSNPMNDVPVRLPSGTVVRVRNIVVFEGSSAKTLALFIETPTQAADSARVAREAKELIDLWGRSAVHAPLTGASVRVCRTPACLEMREAPSEMFFFLPHPDGSWRAVPAPDP
jgi:hypothetical protein